MQLLVCVLQISFCLAGIPIMIEVLHLVTSLLSEVGLNLQSSSMLEM